MLQVRCRHLIGQHVAQPPASNQTRRTGLAELRPVGRTLLLSDCKILIGFCVGSDLVGSTTLSTRMDPEDLREIMSASEMRHCRVRRFGSFVAKYMGDGVLVYFGYPSALAKLALENSALRRMRRARARKRTLAVPKAPLVIHHQAVAEAPNGLV